jgi:uncharacterized protein
VTATGAPWLSRRAGRLIAALVAVVLGSLATVAPALDVPYLAGRVNDLARVLSPAARDRLEAKLRGLEQRTGAQVAVLVIPSLEGESLEAYSVRVAQTWKLGRKGVDDGVLFLVAKNDRKMRIEVGYGLEPRLTDALSRQILDDQVRPRFRANDFDGGIEAGVDAIGAAIEGKAPPAPARFRWRRARAGGFGLVGLLLFMGLFTLVVGVFSIIALLTPGSPGWFLYLFLLPFYLAFPTAAFPPYGGVVAGGAWIVIYPIVRLWLQPGSKDFKRRHPGLAGFATSGSHGGGGGGWSSGGGGGFSGGGGSFGGGGSSSSW